MTSLKKKTFNALLWNFFGSSGSSIITFIISVLLARYIPPKDFGVVAIFNVFISFSHLLSNFGMNLSLIQDKNASEKDYSFVFTFNLSISLLLTLIMFLAAPFIGQFYENKVLEDVFKSLSVIFILTSFSFVNATKCKKELDFKKIAISNFCSVIISGVFGVMMAINGFGIWSLVAQSLLNEIVIVVLLNILSPFNYKLNFSRKIFNKYFSFTANVFLTNLLNIMSGKLDVFIIGKLMNFNFLGIYNRAKNLGQMASSIPISTFLQPILSTFSIIQNDIDRIKRMYHNIIDIIVLTFIPLSIFVSIFSNELIVLLYGKSWEKVALYLPFFLAIAFFHLLRIPANYILLTKKDSKTIFKVNVVISILNLFSLFLLLTNLNWMLYSFILVKIIHLFLLNSYLHYHFTFSHLNLIKSIIKITSISVICALPVFYMSLNLFTGVLSFLFSYILVIYLIDVNEFKSIRKVTKLKGLL